MILIINSYVGLLIFLNTLYQWLYVESRSCFLLYFNFIFTYFFLFICLQAFVQSMTFLIYVYLLADLSPVLWIYVTRTFSLSISNPKCYVGLMVLLNSSGNWFKLLSLCVKIFELLDWESVFGISPILLSFTNYWAFWITSFKDLWASFTEDISVWDFSTLIFTNGEPSGLLRLKISGLLHWGYQCQGFLHLTSY